MSTPLQIFPLRLGADPSITVQLYDRDTTLPVDLTGAASWSASVVTPSGSTVAMDTAVVTDAVNGKVKVGYGAGAMAVAGVYYLSLQCVDTTGKTQIYPYEQGQLRIKVA